MKPLNTQKVKVPHSPSLWHICSSFFFTLILFLTYYFLFLDPWFLHITLHLDVMGFFFYIFPQIPNYLATRTSPQPL